MVSVPAIGEMEFGLKIEISRFMPKVSNFEFKAGSSRFQFLEGKLYLFVPQLN